jgi:DNA topoisomerase-2
MISVRNNGKGIPIVMHRDEKMYVPSMIFGHLLTSSNYDDSQRKVTGGRNGYGAKLCNIYSKEFTVETVCDNKHFKQVIYFIKLFILKPWVDFGKYTLLRAGGT